MCVEIISKISYSITILAIEVRLINVIYSSLPFWKTGMTFILVPLPANFPSLHGLSKIIERLHNEISKFLQHLRLQPIRPHGLIYIQFV